MANDKDKNKGGDKKSSNGGAPAPQDSTRDLRGAAQVARLITTSQGVKGMLLGLGFIVLAILGSCIKSMPVAPGTPGNGSGAEALEPPTKTVEISVPLPQESKWVGSPTDDDWIEIPAGSISWEVQNPQNDKGENMGLNILFWDGTIVTREASGRTVVRYPDGRTDVKLGTSKALWLGGAHRAKIKLAPYSREGGGVAIIRYSFYVRE